MHRDGGCIQFYAIQMPSEAIASEGISTDFRFGSLAENHLALSPSLLEEADIAPVQGSKSGLPARADHRGAESADEHRRAVVRT